MPQFSYNISDSELLPLLSKGDEKAFTEIYNRYWEKLLYLGSIKLRSLAVAEELVQDIFLDLWNRRAQLNITGSLENYLAVSMKYKVINAQVRLMRTQKHLTETGSATHLHRNTTEEWVQFQELQQRLSALVSKLPERCRITYELKNDVGLSQKQIADRLNISEKAVEANLARAMKALRSAINQLFSLFFSVFL
jgi:RNA polymerase sigma factor (sigma-70 family)